MFALLVLLFVGFSAITGCAPGNHLVEGPDGKFYTELQKSRNNKEHCQSVLEFCVELTEQRSHLEFHDNKQFTVVHSKESMRQDFDARYRGLETFTPRGKRNYDKMEELFNRIIIHDEFSGKTPEDIGRVIYGECMQKMSEGTWFRGQLPQQ